MAAYKLYNPQKRTPHPQIHKHTHTHIHSHTRLNKLAAHPRNLICMAFQFVLCCFLLSTFSSPSLPSPFFFFLCWFSFSFYFLYSGPFFVHCSLLVPCLLVLHLPLYKFLVFAPISFQIERWPQSFIFNAPGNEKQRSNMPQLVASRRLPRKEEEEEKRRRQSRLQGNLRWKRDVQLLVALLSLHWH